MAQCRTSYARLTEPGFISYAAVCFHCKLFQFTQHMNECLAIECIRYLCTNNLHACTEACLDVARSSSDGFRLNRSARE